MKTIELTQGKKAIVDDADYYELLKFKWHVSHKKRVRADDCWYAVRNVPKGNQTTRLFMHTQLMDGALFVDHKDGNGLNNQRGNLRLATGSQNNANKQKLVGFTSQFKGAWFAKERNKWRAQIQCLGSTISLGYFEQEQVAALAYDKAAKSTFGNFAKLNF
jgi:hypothetical protein